jgi:indolepyruvate ferredoxin oxidoreductase beta subunit
MFPVTNVVVAGLGGQGVLRGTDILAAVALGAGYDVKRSEVKGMSQRGGSVTGEVRFGERVLSPMVPAGEADFLLALEPTQVEPNRHLLRANGVLITPEAVLIETLPHKRTLNVALLGALSAHLPLARELWLESLRTNFEAGFFEANQKAFEVGRQSQAHARESIGHGHEKH